MTKTYIETKFEECVDANSTVLPLDQSCDLVITSGPTRLANNNPAAFIGLAITALGGYSAKAVVSGSVAATPANFNVDQAATAKAVGLVVTISGAQNTFRRMAQTLTISAVTAGTATPSTVVCYPRKTRCQFLYIFTQDNGGVGQVAVATQPRIAWLVADHSGTVASELVISSEIITVRDFTSRQQNG